MRRIAQFSKVLTVAGFAGAAFASTASATIFTYQLGDHLDGSQTPPYEYGVRIDSEDLFLSLNPMNGANVELRYDDDALTADVSGRGLESLGGGAFGNMFAIDFSFSGIVDRGDGFFTATGGSGTFTDLGTGDLIALASKQDGAGIAFYFLGDGFRLGGDNTSPVGRGWLDARGTNDWLVTGELLPTPIPPAALLFLAGAAGLGAARRRKASQA